MFSKWALCLCMMFVSFGWRSYAQQPPQPANPVEPQQQPQAKPAPAAPPQEAKPVQPVQQQAPVKKTAKPEAEPDTGDDQFSISLFYWPSPIHPIMRSGKAATLGVPPGNLDFPGDSKPVPGAILSIPVKNGNTLRFSYFRTQGQGNTVAASDLSFFGVGYSKGDYLSAGYNLQNAKISLDFLSWPGPQQESTWRLKTFWEVQYTTVRWSIDAPLKPTVDSAGNLLETSTRGSNWFVYPSFGLGVEKPLSRHLRWEAKASGFAIPHFPVVGDAETFAAYRMGHVEVQIGARVFHFKTSPRREEYIRGTLPGAYVSLRLYSKH